MHERVGEGEAGGVGGRWGGRGVRKQRWNLGDVEIKKSG